LGLFGTSRTTTFVSGLLLALFLVENEGVGLLVLCIDEVYIGLPGCSDGATRAEIYPYGYDANLIGRKIRAKKLSYRCSEC
jgi:hypothetical protein